MGRLLKTEIERKEEEREKVKEPEGERGGGGVTQTPRDRYREKVIRNMPLFIFTLFHQIQILLCKDKNTFVFYAHDVLLRLKRRRRKKKREVPNEE